MTWHHECLRVRKWKASECVVSLSHSYSTSPYNKCSRIITQRRIDSRVDLSRWMLHLLFFGVPWDMFFQLYTQSFSLEAFFLFFFWSIEGDSQNWCMNGIFGSNKLPSNGTSFLVWTCVFWRFCSGTSREKERERRSWLDSAWRITLFSYLLMMRLNIKGLNTSSAVVSVLLAAVQPVVNVHDKLSQVTVSL